MHVGSITGSSHVTVLGVRISVNDVRNTLCQFFGIPCDCASILAIPENRLVDFVLDMVTDFIGPAFAGASCTGNLVDLLRSSLAVGIGPGGVSVDINTAALAQSALCNIARLGVKQSGTLTAPARTIVTAIRNTCIEEARASGGTIAVNNNYGTPPVVPQPPMTAPAPSVQTQTLQSNPFRRVSTPKPAKPGVTSTTTSTGKKLVPVLAVTGVALAVSAVILFNRR